MEVSGQLHAPAALLLRYYYEYHVSTISYK